MHWALPSVEEKFNDFWEIPCLFDIHTKISSLGEFSKTATFFLISRLKFLFHFGTSWLIVFIVAAMFWNLFSPSLLLLLGCFEVLNFSLNFLPFLLLAYNLREKRKEIRIFCFAKGWYIPAMQLIHAFQKMRHCFSWRPTISSALLCSGKSFVSRFDNFVLGFRSITHNSNTIPSKERERGMKNVTFFLEINLYRWRIALVAAAESSVRNDEFLGIRRMDWSMSWKSDEGKKDLN